MTAVETRTVGAGLDRVEGAEKVQGQALYAYEYNEEGTAYLAIVQATIARGTIASIGAEQALASAGVVAVLTHESALELSEDAEGELAVLQSARVRYRGQIVAAVVAETPEAADEAARLVHVEYDSEPHDTVLRADHPGLYRPSKVNPDFPTDTSLGDFDMAFEDAEMRIDATYETPAYHNHPMEPHATTARWDGERLTLYDSDQGPQAARMIVAKVFGIDPDLVTVIAPHVGGGFGSKGTVRPHAILAGMAARLAGRPVKLALTRQQMFALTGYRTPTIQRVRLGAAADGRLVAIAHEVIEQSSTVTEFAEQTALATRIMYSSANRRTSHRLVRLDVPTPSWMRAPGECPGMFALETAVDELAVACGVDPVELRIRNEPLVDPETGHPFSSRGLVDCLDEGAERFGWSPHAGPLGRGSEGRWLVGTGVAASTYPARTRPSRARARAETDGTYTISLAASDVGTGSRTVLGQIAADELGVPSDRVTVQLGDSRLPPAPLAGGSMGTASWGTAVVKACRTLLDNLGGALPTEVEVDTTADLADDELARHAFGAQFAEVRIDTDTGEVRVSRLLGVFAAGRILNEKTARSQFLGGMTMGVSMALHEESLLDRQFGDYLNHDFAGYHIATCADIEQLDAFWIDEVDDHLNPLGTKGIGEIGIVGTAAAVGNAVYDASGLRIRALPLRPDRLLAHLDTLR
jgi:xanthine dehydrogenase YagR molybdenum-binding subunit